MKPLADVVNAELDCFSQKRLSSVMNWFQSTDRINEFKALLTAALDKQAFEQNPDFQKLLKQYMNIDASLVHQYTSIVMLRIYLEQTRKQRNLPLLMDVFQSYRTVARNLKEPFFLKFLGETYMLLLKQMPISGKAQIDKDVEALINDQQNPNLPPESKVIIYTLLNQLVRFDNYFTIKEMRKKNYEIFKKILSEKEFLRTRGIDLLKDLIVELSKLDKDEQKLFLLELYSKLTTEVVEKKETLTIDYVSGYLKISCEIFKFMNPQVFKSEFKGLVQKIHEYGLNNILPRLNILFNDFLELLTIMAEYNKNDFSELFIGTICDDLLRHVSLKAPDSSEMILECISKILVNYKIDEMHPTFVRVFVKFLELIRAVWRERSPKIFQIRFYESLKRVISVSYNKIDQNSLSYFLLVNCILLYGLNQRTLDILKIFIKAEDTAKIGRKLLLMICKPLGLDKERVGSLMKDNVSFTESKSDKPDHYETLTKQDFEAIIPTRQLLGEQRDNSIDMGLDFEIFYFRLRSFQESFPKFFDTDEIKSVCLESLAQFDFGVEPEKKSILIKDTVLKYLDSPKTELRKKAAKIVFQLSSENWNKHKEQYSLSHKIIHGIINKLLIIAINDPDMGVREETLSALNSLCPKFNKYLISADNINRLLTCIYDPNLKILKESMIILQKLIPHSPEVLPKLNQLIFAYISFLSGIFREFGEQLIIYIEVLSIFADNGFFLLHEKIFLITGIIVNIATNCFEQLTSTGIEMTNETKVIVALLGCLTKLLTFHTEVCQIYFEKIVRLILKILKLEFTELYESAINTLSILIQFTGYQLFLIVKYDIMNYVFPLLQKNISPQINLALVRFLGVFGAFDPLLISRIEVFKKKIGDRIEKLSNQEIAAFLRKIIHKNLHVIKAIESNAQQSDNNLLKDFQNFTTNVQHLQEYKLDERPSMLTIPKSSDGSFIVLPTIINPTTSKNSIRLIEKVSHNAKLENHLEMSIHGDEKMLEIMVYKIFYTLFTQAKISAHDTKRVCFRIMEDACLLLGRDNARFLDFIFFNLLDLLERFELEQSAILREQYQLKILQIMGIFINFCFIALSKNQEYISLLFKHLIALVNRDKLQKHIFSIFEKLLSDKRNSTSQAKEIANSLLLILVNNPLTSNAEQIFKILKEIVADDILDINLNILIKVLNNYVDRTISVQKTPPDLVKRIYDYFNHVLRFPEISNYYSILIRSTLEFLDKLSIRPSKTDEEVKVIEAVRAFLVEFINSQKEKCLSYIPLIHNYIKDEPVYREIIEKLQINGYFVDVMPSRTIEHDYRAENVNITLLKEDITNHPFKDNMIRRFDWNVLSRAFNVSGNTKPDDWDAWFHRLQRAIIQQSPASIYAYCEGISYIEDLYRNCSRIAFTILWSKLDTNQRAEVIQVMKDTLDSESVVPNSILKSFVKLTEYISRDSTLGYVVDYNKITEVAMKCNLYENAVYFKEQEFLLSPTKDNKTKLIEIYTRLGCQEAAEGLVELQSPTSINLEIDWLESLKRWRQGLTEHKKNEQENKSLGGQIRCFAALSQWEFVLEKIKELESKTEDPIIISQVQKNVKALVGKYGTKAAFHLSKWSEIEKYNENAEPGHYKDFFNAVLAIKDRKFTEAESLIASMRKNLTKEVDSYTNYQNSYEKILRIQEVAELEEVILLERNLVDLRENEVSSYLLGKERQQKITQGIIDNMNHFWDDRFSCLGSPYQNMERFISIRVLNQYADVFSAKLAFAKQCYAEDNFQLYKKVLKNLQLQPKNMKQKEMLELEYMSCLFKTSELKETKVEQYINTLINEPAITADSKYLFYKKAGKWLLEQDDSTVSISLIIRFLEMSLTLKPDQTNTWHYFAIANSKCIDILEKNHSEQQMGNLLKNAFKGFVKTISSADSSSGKYVIQDLLKLMDLWFTYGDTKEIKEQIPEAIETIKVKEWLLIITHIISRIEMGSEDIRESTKTLLLTIAKENPQALIFPLLLARSSTVPQRTKVANKILLQMAESHQQLIDEALIFSEELIKVSVLLEEQWIFGILEASKYHEANNLVAMENTLNKLFEITRFNSSPSEIGFFHDHGYLLIQAKEALDLFNKFQQQIFLNKLWTVLFELHSILETRKNDMSNIYLESVSPALLAFKNSQIFIPGTDKKKLPEQRIRIQSIKSELSILSSKRRPKKLNIIGINGKIYPFLLKGNEDLRQDERAMQVLNLVNDLFKKNLKVDHKTLKIVTFNVLPLSTNTGIISWLEGCDTLYSLIMDYRKEFSISIETEKILAYSFFHEYDILSKLRKLEIYQYVCENTKAEDLKKILWLRNESAETWFVQRQNYIRSLAVMSIVGYVLGLGDRHLANLMLQRSSGKIVHIDFGDCFEIASRRERYPEKVPFRLTRVLVNAMEACGIAGTFKATCEKVMRLVRSNKESLEATLEEFVFDPLVNWQRTDEVFEKKENYKPAINEDLNEKTSVADGGLRSPKGEALDEEIRMPDKNSGISQSEEKNSKAVEATQRIRSKLNGRDFNESEPISSEEQVQRLIREAVSSENICQSYSGWNPFL